MLGKEVKQIRKTDEKPPRASIYDVISAVTGLNGNHAGKAYRDIIARYPEVHSPGVNFRFRGRGQRDTPVADAKGMVEIIMLLPGQMAAQIRHQAATLLCRYLGGDLSLVDEVCALRGFQEQVAVDAPEDPRRLFGEAVEASSSSTSTQLANLFAAMNQRLTNQEKTSSAQDKLLACES